jgi:branched-chain amino acid transport system ATP-binding protein
LKRKKSATYRAARDMVAFLEIDHVKDEKAGNLSGGQKKLLELGRALMRKPKIILLDEIGAGINRTLLAKISDKILLSQQGTGADLLPDRARSRLCVQTLRRGDRDGAGPRLLTSGSVDEVRQDARVIEAYFGGGKYEAQS